MKTRSGSVRMAFKWDVAPQAINHVEPVGLTISRHRFPLIVAASIGLHILAFVIRPDLFLSPSLLNMEESWSIDVDMFTDLSNQAPQETALPKSQKSEQEAVPANLLPQLPKKFEVQDQKPVTDKTNAEEKDPDAEDAVADKRVQAPEREEIKKTEEDANKVDLDDLKKRLAVEKLKQQNKIDEKMKAQKDAIAKLKDELKTDDGPAYKGGSGGPVASIRNTTYLDALKVAVKRNWNLPETYKYKSSKPVVVFSISINDRGDLMKMKMETSSGDESYDKAAVATLQRTVPFPKPPRDLVGVEIPFKFSM